jgi:hypothetical protein
MTGENKTLTSKNILEKNTVFWKKGVQIWAFDGILQIDMWISGTYVYTNYSITTILLATLRTRTLSWKSKRRWISS